MDKPKYTQPIFLKFGEAQHMVDLFQNGTLYCGNLHSFAKLEDNVGRGDVYETIFDIDSTKKLKGIEVDINTEKISHSFDVDAHLVKHLHDEDLAGNIFCLYTHECKMDKVFNPILVETKKLGEYCVVITHPDIFIKRVHQKLDELKRKYFTGFVKYLDFSSYTGKKNPFQKPLELQNQHEFRFYIHNENNEALKFQIGSLKDIAFVTYTNELKNCGLVTFENGEKVIIPLSPDSQAILNKDSK